MQVSTPEDVSPGASDLGKDSERNLVTTSIWRNHTIAGANKHKWDIRVCDKGLNKWTAGLTHLSDPTLELNLAGCRPRARVFWVPVIDILIDECGRSVL